MVSKEIEVNPTIVDLYVLKAEIYRDAGDVITASKWMDEAQSLDTADRFINAQCTKYMVQAHRMADAEAMASKFTRGSTTATQYLTEMQCMWFLIENALAYKAMQKYGDALKFCHEIDRVGKHIFFFIAVHLLGLYRYFRRPIGFSLLLLEEGYSEILRRNHTSRGSS